MNNFLIKNKNVLKDYDHYDYYPKSKQDLKDNIIELLTKGETDLNCIDTSNITDMSWLFSDINPIINISEIDISEWNVSNVVNMIGMFKCCNKFNSDLSNWDISNVINMRSMFNGCKKFKSDISNWNISNLKSARYIFNGCKELKENNLIPDWYFNGDYN